MRSRFRWIFGVVMTAVALVASSFWPARASAYSYGSVVSDACHERIASHALRAVRRSFPNAQPLPPRGEDDVLIDDLPFDVDRDMRDIGGAALLVGVRDNDLKGRFGTESTDLASVHGNPDGQQEHCLRRGSQDEPGGSEAALQACRGFIRNMAIHAIDNGLDAAGAPDPGKRTYVKVYLSFAGKVQAMLPIFYVYMGQSLHTLQDSFTHAFRTADHRKVTVVLNWVDFVDADLDERHDGPPHMVSLDQCEDLDDFRKQRLALASQASVELLSVAIDPAKSRDAKVAAIDEVLDAYMTFQPGCTFDTRWCDAPENQYRVDEGCGCKLGHRAGAPRPWWASVLIAAAIAVARRGRRRARATLVGCAAIGATLMGPETSAFAQSNPSEPAASSSTAAPARASCVPGQQIACGCPGGAIGVQRCEEDGRSYGECSRCAQPERALPSAAMPPAATAATPPAAAAPQAAPPARPAEPPTPWALYMAASAAVDHPALAFAVAARYQFSDRWHGGVDGEWNPWFSYETKRVKPGTANVYATLIRRYPVSDTMHLRTTMHLGASALLFDIYGAPAGTFGPYVGVNLIGIEWALGRSVHLIIEPGDVAISVPHLTGAPLTYRQYRFTVGVQFGD